MLYREDNEVVVFISHGGATTKAKELAMQHQCTATAVQYRERGCLKGYAVDWHPKVPTIH